MFTVHIPVGMKVHERHTQLFTIQNEYSIYQKLGLVLPDGPVSHHHNMFTSLFPMVPCGESRKHICCIHFVKWIRSKPFPSVLWSFFTVNFRSHYPLTQVKHGMARNKLQCESIEACRTWSSTTRQGEVDWQSWPRIAYSVNTFQAGQLRLTI